MLGRVTREEGLCIYTIHQEITSRNYYTMDDHLGTVEPHGCDLFNTLRIQLP